jgi:hypothetical protein
VTPEYLAWNAALASRFLQGHAGEPLYLYTDEAVLEEVCAQVGVPAVDALSSFVSAVRGATRSNEPFRSWLLESARAVPEGSVPSYLGVLCFLVLAAVERETTRFQYYPELNAFLGRPRDAGAPAGFDVHVPGMFRHFNEWLQSDGAIHGVPTARSHEHFPNIGWPLSQAIVRPLDRALLVRLFASQHLSPGAAHTGAWLRAKLVPRLTTSAASPSRSRLLDLNDNHGELLEDVLEQEYRAWDGAASIAIGPRRVLVRVCHDETRGEWWLLAPRIPGTEGSTWHIGEASGAVPRFKGAEVALPDEELWRLVGSGDIGRIEEGPVLCSRAARMRWLALDTAAGAWAEVGRRDPGADQLVLVDVADAERLCAVAGIARREGAPPGHALLQVSTGTLLDEQALPAAQARPRFEGGLRLSGATSTYLRVPTGLPRIRPAVVARLGDEPLVVEGGEARLPAQALAAGDHVVEVDGERLPFRLVDRLQQGPADTAAPAWIDELPAVRRLRVPHDSGSIWLVGERGELEERPGSKPSWLEHLNLLAAEVDVASAVRTTWFEPAYIVSSFQGKAWVERVPDAMAQAQPSERPRDLNKAHARELVSHLFTGYGPKAREHDAQWKRCMAALLRTAHA